LTTALEVPYTSLLFFIHNANAGCFVCYCAFFHGAFCKTEKKHGLLTKDPVDVDTMPS
jgi:hypothetical protein